MVITVECLLRWHKDKCDNHAFLKLIPKKNETQASMHGGHYLFIA